MIERQMGLRRTTEMMHEKGGRRGGREREGNEVSEISKTWMKQDRARWVVENSTGI